jgi:aspartyl-tRNA(Asn)/glutamyl-tRNA(Gln) amidotransferase subunit C
MSVSLEEVRHIAALARLGLDEARLASLAQELNSILGHMAALSRADTTGVPDDDISGRGEMPLRPDGGEPLKLERPVEDFAPAVRDSFLVVPRLATHEEGTDE